MENLVEALQALVDARLQEHGLLDAPAAKGKAKANGKGKAAKEEVEDDGEITLETLKAKVTDLVDKQGKDAAKALLKKAKVEKLVDLAEKHYEKFNTLLDEALKAGGEEDEDELFGDD
jgi:hypothetical protein